jgi:putative restriction endonuclease
MDIADDLRLRRRIMEVLAARRDENGSFSREELSAFTFDGTTRRLIDSSKGIWNPRDLNATLTVLSSHDGPYADADVGGGLLRYDYRAGSLDGDNRKLRLARDLQLPVILIRKITKGVYVPIFPAYVVEDDVERRQFVLAFDEALGAAPETSTATPLERRYAERRGRQRLHQPEFRARVLLAYRTRCAICGIDHGYLLDAAHIVGDADELGDPLVSNGLCLCKLHHAAYDRFLIGIAPDYVIHVGAQLRGEAGDNPMVQHAFTDFIGHRIAQPTRDADHADPERLAVRYERFLREG